jgi:hypothetical protein
VTNNPFRWPTTTREFALASGGEPIQQRHSRVDEHQIRLQIHNLEELRITKSSELI